MNQGVCVFSNKLKMACARTLKALIIFGVNRWKTCWVFNYCTKFQTICFSLSPLTYSRKLTYFACLINASLRGRPSILWGGLICSGQDLILFHARQNPARCKSGPHKIEASKLGKSINYSYAAFVSNFNLRTGVLIMGCMACGGGS